VWAGRGAQHDAQADPDRKAAGAGAHDGRRFRRRRLRRHRAPDRGRTAACLRRGQHRVDRAVLADREHISRKIAAAEWGDGVVQRLAAHIAKTQPGLRGFTRPNLFRMRQFYEAYADQSEKVSALLRQIPWTHHLSILGQSKSSKEREFYLRLVAREKWSSRELERQFKAALFERAMAVPPKVSAALAQTHPEAAGAFKDAYMLEFLGLPPEHSEADLHASLLERLRQFLIELGRDFCFAGSQYPMQVGGRDFALDCSDRRVIPMAA
jgi:predicted nuclease of restriction endonuclease-like (RecB) superfamily